MSVPASTFDTDIYSGLAVAVPFVIFVAALVIEIALKNKEKKAKKEAELKEMLNKPLETFGSTEAADLAKKYEQDDSKKETAEDEVPIPPKPSQYNAVTDVDYVEYCTKCGQKVEDDHVYCSNCGEKL